MPESIVSRRRSDHAIPFAGEHDDLKRTSGSATFAMTALGTLMPDYEGSSLRCPVKFQKTKHGLTVAAAQCSGSGGPHRHHLCDGVRQVVPADCANGPHRRRCVSCDNCFGMLVGTWKLRNGGDWLHPKVAISWGRTIEGAAPAGTRRISAFLVPSPLLARGEAKRRA
jgi:hypothetical protein